MSKYAIGIDFGTESGRVLLVDVTDGNEIASSVHRYANGVIDKQLPGNNMKLDPDWALQDPADYIDVLKVTVPNLISQSGVEPGDIIGIGIDFTACTLMPVKKDGTPLCFIPDFRPNPHSWAKLWKHHAAQPEANKLNQIAGQMEQEWLNRYGGRISSEWFFPKALQIVNEAPELYEEADRLIEAGDWIVWQLTGNETRNSCAAGYKALWSKREGFPPNSFFKAIDPRLENVIDSKLSRDILPVGKKAGNLTPEAAVWMGLKPGTAVASANVDAHVSVPAVAVTDIGKMVMIMGTSNCHMVLTDKERIVPGICGYVEDGILPGLYGFEAGQSCVGDHFAWVIENCVPESYKNEATKRGLSIHKLLEKKASKLKPGESGLLALDWWNGNRSILVDADLTGLLVGVTLGTRPEEIYRALIEATAYGTRTIIENFKNNGIPVNEIIACGGLPEKNQLLMQIYADVTGYEIKISKSTQTSALGSAMFGAVAAGKDAGGHSTIIEAAQAMASLQEISYKPITDNQVIYDRIYKEYVILHDYFGRAGNDVMKRLKAIKDQSLSS